MTSATQLEIRLTDLICQKTFPFDRFVKISQWIINRQADRQEAARLGVKLNDYKRNLKPLIKATKTY